jgi:hypothetical protein
MCYICKTSLTLEDISHILQTKSLLKGILWDSLGTSMMFPWKKLPRREQTRYLFNKKVPGKLSYLEVYL